MPLKEPPRERARTLDPRDPGKVSPPERTGTDQRIPRKPGKCASQGASRSATESATPLANHGPATRIGGRYGRGEPGHEPVPVGGTASGSGRAPDCHCATSPVRPEKPASAGGKASGPGAEGPQRGVVSASAGGSGGARDWRYAVAPYADNVPESGSESAIGPMRSAALETRTTMSDPE